MLAPLTLITTAYNAERFIDIYSRNVSQLLARNCSIIFVDDCSEDHTADIQDLLGNDKFTYIRNPENIGLGPSRNKAMRLVKTPYLAMMDVDDWVAPEKMTEAFSYVSNNPAIDVARTGHVTVRYKKRNIVKAPAPAYYHPLTQEELIGSSSQTTMVDYPYAWAGFYKTSCLLDNDIFFDELHTCEDRKFIWKLALSGINIVAIPHLYYFYSQDDNPQANTQCGDRHQLDFIPAYERLLQNIGQIQDGRFLDKLIRQMAVIIINHIKRKDRFSKKDQKLLFSGCSELLGKVPRPARQRLMKSLSPERQKVLLDLL